ncbi:hypothetical protein CYPRO_2473 [Cyclonatronum proteinivorum]|uniref:Uncharacterized protein n=1 Tax=Cyclonatronum proteinivorum TaxID=1457365 RepID=A0A345UML3_9BACT|nr:hypothetical protein CYPRO_2473 [Cyclonatronum proteinivorum]
MTIIRRISACILCDAGDEQNQDEGIEAYISKIEIGIRLLLRNGIRMIQKVPFHLFQAARQLPVMTESHLIPVERVRLFAVSKA